jgi:hypothetical protein
MTTTPNLDLLDAVVAHIEAHPEQHDQSEWICGTAACVAGHAALLGGWKPVFNPPCGTEGCDCHLTTSLVEKDGQRRGVDLVAVNLLGLAAGTAYELFRGDNTLADIRRIQGELHAAYHSAESGAA